MIKKILIANRGEIAVRIMQTCHELNIKTVAIYSNVDKYSRHVQMADESFCIGSAPSQESYLNINAIINVAILANADAIHPGYGFLSENDKFAKACEDSNITFVGPSSTTITKMGIKDIARKTMEEAGVPIVPGSKGTIKDEQELKKTSNNIGYPVIIKATAGGGGKGIRIAYNEKELIKGYKATQKEANKAFGNSEVYLEKYIEDFRHIEIQILADKLGNTVYLGERDCSIQRRLQKLIEEAPSPAITEDIRRKMGESAVKAAKAVNYVGAGTIEYIFNRENNEFYFMEMNTRIQVEHPVTELITGIDIVKEQINIANNNLLPFKQQNIHLKGWAIESRINAEDPFNDFLPSPGEIKYYSPPSGLGVRIDSSVYNGYYVLPYYDSMVAKLITYSDTRNNAIEKMNRSLKEFSVEGIKTTIPFLQKVIKNEKFQNGDFNTNFIEDTSIFEL